MGACVLGIDEIKRPKVFMDWLKEAQAKIDYMGISDNKQKVALLRSWAGRELLNFWEKEARIQFTAIPVVAATGDVEAVAEIPADTFEDIITKTKKDPQTCKQGQIPNRSSQHETRGRDMDAIHK